MILLGSAQKLHSPNSAECARSPHQAARPTASGSIVAANRQANAALYRVAIVRMRNHPPTLAYVSKRKKEGKTNREIIRCLKRYIVREIFSHLCRPQTQLASA